LTEELKFVLSTEAQGAEDAQQRSTRAIQQVGRVFTAIRENVRQTASDTNSSMNAIKQQVTTTANEISNRYNTLSLTQLQNEFVKLEEKIRLQETALRQTEQEFEEFSQWNQRFNGDAYTGWLAELGDKANQAEDDLIALKDTQAQVAAAINVKIQGQQETDQLNAQLKETKQQSAQARMGLDSVANGLSIVGRASGGTVSQITGLIQEVRFLKQGFTATAATAGASAAIISTAFGVAGVVIMAIMAVINAVVAATEKEKEKLKEARQEIDDLRSNTQGASELVSEYEELSKKIVKSADDTQRMLEIRAELVETYGFAVGAVSDEGILLSGNLDIMKEQLKVSQELLLAKLQESQPENEDSFDKNFSDYISKTQELAKLKENLAMEQKYLEDMLANPTSYGTNLGDMVTASSIAIAMLESSIDSAETKLDEAQKEVRESVKSIFQVMILTAQAEGKEVPEPLQMAISKALNQAIAQAFKENIAFTAEQAELLIQSMIDAFYAVSSGVVSSSVPAIESFRQSMIAALTSTEGIDDAAAQNLANSIMNALIGDNAENEAIFSRLDELRERIWNGLATADEIEEYDNLVAIIGELFIAAQEAANQAIEDGVPGAKQAKVALSALASEYITSSEVLTAQSAAAKAASMSLEDVADSLRSVARGYENVADAIKEVARLKGAVQAILDYNSGVDQSAEAAERAAKARKYLAQQYGVEEEAVDDMIPSIQDEIELKETLALLDYEVAVAAVYAAKAQILAMLAARTITQEEGWKIIDVLNTIIEKLNEIGSVSISGDSVNASDDYSTPTVRTSGGGGSRTNKALEKQMDLIEHKKALDQLTTAEEIALLEKALAKYAKTTAEKEDLTEKLYDLRKQKAEDDLEYQKAMDQLTLREEIAAVEAMIATYKEGTQARRELETELYQLKRQLERQEYDLAVYYGQLTLEEQEAAVRAMIETYEEGVEARIDLEKELYDIQQQIRQRDIDRLNNLIDAVISSLRARYDAQREAEKDTLEASIKAWKDWGNEQVDAIQRQIDALDELTQEEDDAEVEAAKRRKISMLEQALLYEQDAYNRRKLQEQLAAAQADLDDWLKEQEREAAKKALQAQIDQINETVDTQTDALEEQLDAVDDYYDQLTEEQRLQAEAQQLLMQSSQEDIIALLASFAPEYNATGQTLGEQFYDGFMSQVGSIEEWFQGLIAGLSSNVTNYLQQMAGVANSAANQYAASSGATTTTTDSYNNTKTVSPVININITATGADGGMTPSERQEMIDDIVAALSDM